MSLVLLLEFEKCCGMDRSGAARYRPVAKGVSLAFDPGVPDAPLETRLDLDAALGKVGEDYRVSARIWVSDEWANEHFVLTTGNDPDSKVEFSPRDIDTDQEGDKWMCGRFNRDDRKLFCETFGESELILRHERSKLAILRTPVVVRARAERDMLMRATISELMTIAPQTIISEMSGQNRSIVDDDWHMGSASFAFPELELAEIEKVVLKISPLLYAINRVPASKVISRDVNMPLMRARTLSKQAVKKLARYGCPNEGSEMCVLAKLRVKSNDVAAHVAIKSFIQKLLRRLKRLNSVAIAEKISAEDSMREMTAADPKTREIYGFELSDVRKRISYTEDFIGRIEVVSQRVRLLMRIQFVRMAMDSGSPIYAVKREEFLYNRYYARTFDVMREFEDKHFWWIPIDRSTGLVHRFKLTESSCTKQRKYSILYEFWCFWRLVRAFEQVGFDFGDARNELRRRLARSIVVGTERDAFSAFGKHNGKSELEVQIIHDYAAYSPLKVPGAEFTTEIAARYDKNGVLRDGREQNLETPDFAIMFVNRRTKKWQWIVLDAKSSTRLRAEQVKKQSNYFNQTRRRPDISKMKMKVWQSWLIYAGNVEKPGGVELCQDEDVQDRSWAERDVGEISYILERINQDTICSKSGGVVFDQYFNVQQFAGEIRGNAVSSPMHDIARDPFLDFAKIQMRTVARYLWG